MGEDNIAHSSQIESMIEMKKQDLKKETKKEDKKDLDIAAKEGFLPEFDLQAKKADKIYNGSSSNYFLEIILVVNPEDFDLLDISDYQSIQNT